MFWGGKPSHWVHGVSVHVGHENGGADGVDEQPVGRLQDVSDSMHDKATDFSSEIKHFDSSLLNFSKNKDDKGTRKGK